MAYLLDANVLIEAKNRYYGMDFCPAFWDWIDAAHAAGSVFSIDKVRDELVSGEDDLADWARQRGGGFFLKPDGAVLLSLRAVSAWAVGAPYDQAAVNGFLDGADFYLVAHAHAHGHTLVTHERAGAVKKVKIPDACIGLDVQFTQPFAMLRGERASFVLGG
jgi:uncharacterized protein DUF4411